MKKKKDIIDALERDAAGRISTNDYDEVPREEASKIRKLIRQAALPKTVVISCRSYNMLHNDPASGAECDKSILLSQDGCHDPE